MCEEVRKVVISGSAVCVVIVIVILILIVKQISIRLEVSWMRLSLPLNKWCVCVSLCACECAREFELFGSMCYLVRFAQLLCVILIVILIPLAAIEKPVGG